MFSNGTVCIIKVTLISKEFSTNYLYVSITASHMLVFKHNVKPHFAKYTRPVPALLLCTDSTYFSSHDILADMLHYQIENLHLEEELT